VRRAALLVALGVIAGYLMRAQLVGMLTKTTGTWVGAPPPPKVGP
jgi:hypothetical protein